MSRLVPSPQNPTPQNTVPRGNTRSPVDLSRREIASLLAALRLWQSRLNWFDGGHGEPPRLLDLMDVATDGSSLQRLSCTEIDALCQRLALGDACAEAVAASVGDAA